MAAASRSCHSHQAAANVSVAPMINHNTNHLPYLKTLSAQRGGTCTITYPIPSQTIPRPPVVPVPRRTAFLDGLQGLAAFLVYMHHQTAFFYGDETDIDRGYGAVYQDANGKYVTTRYFASFPVVRLLYSGGNAMVAIFFVLSGYVLSRSFLLMIYCSSNVNHDQPRPKVYSGLLAAAVRRPFRLYLPSLGVAFIYAISMHLPFGFKVHTSVPEPQSSLLLELVNLANESTRFFNPFQEHGFYLNWYSYDLVLWTLPVELKGSMLVYVLIALLSFTAKTWLQRYEVFCISVLAVGLLFIYQWTMALFMAGLLLCMIEISEVVQSTAENARQHADHLVLPSIEDPIEASAISSTEPNTARLRRASYASSSPSSFWIMHSLELLLGVYFLTQPSRVKDVTRSTSTPGWFFLTTRLTPPNYVHNEYWRFYESIGAVMIMHSLLHLPHLQKALSTKVLLFLGRISFSLYLIHVPFLLCYGDVVQRSLGVVTRNWKDGPLWTDGKLKWLFPEFGPVGLSSRYLVTLGLVLPPLLFISILYTKSVDEKSVKISRMLSMRLGLSAFAETGETTRKQQAGTNVFDLGLKHDAIALPARID